jgi:pimeloyl-ACP methyl ester carboxylesterase
MKILGNLYNENKFGAIGILWNGQGASAGRTMNDNAYVDLNDFMKLVLPALKINPDQVIAFGGSRGGVSALNIASHTAITSFRVRYVMAQVPPDRIDFIRNLTGPSVPDLMYASDWSTGYVGSWAKNFIYRGISGITLTGSQAHSWVLTGTADAALLQQHFNLSSPEKISNLLNRKTEVYLELGSHDVIVPGVDQFRFFKAYQAAKIPVETRINYLAGHNGWAKEALVTKAIKTISNEILFAVPKSLLITPNAVHPFWVPSSGSDVVPYVKAQNRFPLTLEIPRYIHENVNSYFIATGNPGQQYRMIFIDMNGVKKIINFTLDQIGTWTGLIDPAIFTPGVNTVDSVLALNAQGQPYEVLTTLRTSLPMSGKIVMERYVGDLRQFGARLERFIKAGYMGANYENAFKIGPSPDVNVTNGLVEKIGEGKPYIGL